MEQPGDRSEPLVLSSYVATLATRRLVGRREPLREPEGEQLAAAVLFADISGFTALTERLARTGPGGVEELTELLNGCFGRLVQLVVDHGGDVGKFAGDALLALWAANDGLAGLTTRAAGCGLAMQEVLHASELAAGTRLSVRVGVGAGQVSTAHLGGVRGRWEFVVGGPAVTQACGAEQLGRPGDVVLSAEAADQVGDACAGEPVPAGPGRRPGLRATTVQPLPPAAPLVSSARQAVGTALRGCSGSLNYRQADHRRTTLHGKAPGHLSEQAHIDAPGGPAVKQDVAHQPRSPSLAALLRWSGLALVAGGLLMAMATVLHPNRETPTTIVEAEVRLVAAHALFTLSSLLLLLGLPGLYGAASVRMGRLGLVGFLAALPARC